MYVNDLARNRFFSREENDGGGGGQEKEKQQNEFKPITSQADFDRAVQDRIRRAEQKYADYDALKAKSELWDQLEKESQTDAERRERELREEALQEAMLKTVPKAVRAEFRAAAKGVLTPEQLESLLEDLDLTRYATDDGDPDEEKIGKKIAAFAPKDNGHGPGFGQGSGYDQSIKRKGEAGLEEAKKRWPQQFAESKS